MPKALLTRYPLLTATTAAMLCLSACSGGDNGDKATSGAMGEQDFDYIGEDVTPGRALLGSVIEPLFSDELPGQTRALVIMQGGEIVAERYGENFNAETKLVGWSLSKSVTAVLIGILVTDGRLALDEPAPVPAWSSPGDPRGKITIRQLLQMSSGLDHEEGLASDAVKPVYEGDTARMLYLDGSADMASYAERRPLESAPGRKFEYSTSTTMILADIITRALTASEDPAVRRRHFTEFAEGRLFEPLGLSSMTMEFDDAGTMVGGSYIHATARDWAKFGEFLRNNGSVAGAQIVPGPWLEFMKAAAPTNANYGGHIWRNVERTDGGEQQLFPGMAPASLIAGLGHYGQYMLVSPQQRLTVVRLGMNETDTLPEITRHLGRVVALFPTYR